MKTPGTAYRTLSKTAYWLGSILLIAALLLGVVNTPASATPSPDWDKSSLVKVDGCDGSCSTNLWFKIKNDGSAMKGTTTYEVRWIPLSQSGNAKSGVVVSVGTIPALAKNGIYTITYVPTTNPNGASGKYIFRVIQRPGHPGKGELWSGECSITSCPVTPTPPTPTEVTPTEVTPTEVTPTEVTPTEVTPTKVTPTEVTPTEVTPTEVTPTEVTPTEVTPTEVTPTEVTPTEVTPTEVTPTKVTPTEVTPTEVTPTEVTPTEVTPTEVTPTEVTPTEVTPTEVTPTEVTPTEVTPTEVTPTVVEPTEATPTENPTGQPTTVITEVPTVVITTPNPTEPGGGGSDTPATLAPPSVSNQGVLIPVTGGDLAGTLQVLLLNLGLIFFGLGFVLKGISNRS